jgi:hypothetical protein
VHAIGEGRLDLPLDELRAGGAEQEQLGPRSQLDRRALEQLAHHLARLRAARLAQKQGVRPELARKQARLSRLARSVDALERDEQRD